MAVWVVIGKLSRWVEEGRRIEYRSVTSQKSKFLKLWDLLRYSEST